MSPSNKQSLIRKYQPYFVFSGVILAFISYIFLSGRIPDFFRGEAFYEFHWTETEPFLRALMLHYQENGRFFSWVYTEGLYKLIGYQPVFFHLFAILLDYLGVLAASMAVFRIWPKRLYHPNLVVLFGLLAFFFPHSANWFIFFASDHYYLTILIFFISVLLIQEWAFSGLKPAYFVIGLACFLVALFTYEHVAFLFPLALAMSYPLIPKTRRTRKLTIKLILIGFVSLVFVIMPLLMYQKLSTELGGAFVHPAFTNRLILSQIPAQVRDSAGLLITYLVYMASGLETLKFADPFAFIFFFGVALWIGWRLFGHGRAAGSLNVDIRQRLIALYFSSLFFVLLGLFPFVAWGELPLPHVRFYAIPLYGLVILLLLAISLATNKSLKMIFGTACVLIIMAGLFEYQYVSATYLESEFAPTENYLSLVQIVPRVREKTTFIFIDNPLGNNAWTGCALALRVLYDTQGLRCAHLSSSEDRYAAVRNEDGLLANEGGFFSDEKWILIGTSPDGSRYILSEINPNTKVLVDWVSKEPIYTDYRRIISDQGPPNSQMYLHLVKRWSGR